MTASCEHRVYVQSVDFTRQPRSRCRIRRRSFGQQDHHCWGVGCVVGCERNASRRRAQPRVEPKSPTLGGSSGSSGFTGTYAGARQRCPQNLDPRRPGGAHDGSGPGAGGSVLDITLHLTASLAEADHSVVRGTESLFGPFGGLASSGSPAIAMNAEANRFHSLLWVQSQFGVCPGS